MLKPTTGSVKIFGEETKDKKVSLLSRKVGYVFQNPDDMLFSTLNTGSVTTRTVYSNVMEYPVL